MLSTIDEEGDAHGVDLARADLAECGDEPLTKLRSDMVGTRFVTQVGGGINVLVARMTVPSGPWPGHYGLEAVVFTAEVARMPPWFPRINHEFVLHFCKIFGATNGISRGEGGVIFPELLSLSATVTRQSFGLVFIDKLTTLYRERALALAAEVAFDPVPASPEDLRQLRAEAFLAHEWGHLSGPISPDIIIQARRGRLTAIVSEIQADLSALVMLLEEGSPRSVEIAKVLAVDRILREAWLPRGTAQVTSITARQILLLIRKSGGLERHPGGIRFKIEDLESELRRALSVIRSLEAACVEGKEEPALRYLAEFGWSLSEKTYRIETDDELFNEIRERAERLRQIPVSDRQ